ncbi:MAG: isochorismatase family protein [Pseudomonadota bacterium]
MIARAVNRFGQWLVTREMRGYDVETSGATAVLVLSGQRAFLDEDGPWADLCQHPVSLPALRQFLDRCRNRDYHIVHVPLDLEDVASTSAIGETHFFRMIEDHGLLAPSSNSAKPASDLIDVRDIVIPARKGLNAFSGTGLHAHLKTITASRIIIVGGLVNADVDSTARMAVELDYDVTIVADLIASLTDQDRKNTLEITLPRIVGRVASRSTFD